MSDLHIEVCTAIEDKICDELGMLKCEKTYELAVDILETIVEKLDGITIVLPESLEESYRR